MLSTIIIGGILAVLVFFAARHIVRCRKAGKCAGCSGCSDGGQHCSCKEPQEWGK